MSEQMQEIRFLVGEVWKGVYDEETSYGNANVVQDPTGLSVYRSLKMGNVGHPLSDTTWWFCIINLSSIKTESDRIAALNDAIAQDEALRVAAEELRQQHEQQRIEAETARETAELTRVSNEATRVSNEATRVSQEQGRVSAEQGRVSAEEARVTAEAARVLAETLRDNAEDARAIAEQNRAAAEQQRISNEATRVSNEQARVTAEAAREQVKAEVEAGEAQRVLAEQSRVTAENGRVSAEEARVSAESSRVAEEQSRVTAEAARVAAETSRETTFSADHTQAVADHTQAVADHAQAESDHARAEGDHSTAQQDHINNAAQVTAAQQAATEAAAKATEAANDATAVNNAIQTLIADTQHIDAAVAAQVVQNTTDIGNLKTVVADLETIAEGYVRVAGSSSPALSYKSYKYHEQGGFGRESVFHLFYPCLVGTKLSGNDAQVGKVLHVLKKLGAVTVDNTPMWEDINGNMHAIDGSEGDVLIVNIEPYFRIMGKHTISGTAYDVFLVSRTPFTWQGIDAEEVGKFGWSPDYCVSHTDTDNVVRMHSVFNPVWNGSYSAPAGVVGKYVYSVDSETSEVVETYDENETLLGGAGGLHTTDIDLPTGEQYAMNQNPDTTKPVPWYNHTAAGAENLQVLLLAEGGTFDAHNANLMGSGFSSNDAATAAGDWEQAGSGAKNGMRVEDKNGTWKYYSFASNVRFLFGEASGTRYAAQCINSWRNPFHILEAHRAMSYAIQNDVHELEWFIFEGNKYKYRSVTGFNTPAQGEMTCVLWKLMATKAGANAKDPTDGTTSIAGNRVEILVSVALFHGMVTQVSPSWWTSGLIFTEDASQKYEAYMERDQTLLLKSVYGDINISDTFNFEEHYKHVGTFTNGEGYRKNYSNDALMLPDTNANKTGAGLHTYVGAYNWFTGGAAPTGKKSVRGFRRGNAAFYSFLSPLTMGASYAPSYTIAYYAFGTCCQIVE